MNVREMESHWRSQFVDKTVLSLRPKHDTTNGVPKVELVFTDSTMFTIGVVEGVFFEGCMINTLRRAQPVVDVAIVPDEHGAWMIEVSARSFPLFMLMAENKGIEHHAFPFTLDRRVSNDVTATA